MKANRHPRSIQASPALVNAAAGLLVLALLASPALAIDSAQSGNWSNTATWVGGTVPGSGDTVVINGGNTVTVDQSATIGDDVSNNAMVIYGTLTWGTPSGDHTLTTRGPVTVISGGSLLMGTVANPIPANRTATLVLNSTSTANPYGLTINNGGKLIAQGAAKDYTTKLLSDAAAGAAVITVQASSEIEGWNVGDVVTVAKYRRSNSPDIDRRTIAQISGSQITLDSALTYFHNAQARVSNLTRNVVIRGADFTNRGYIYNLNSTALANFDLDYV